MSLIYFGFAIADSMFPNICSIKKEKVDTERFKEIISTEKIISCLNPSHRATITAMDIKFGIIVPIPEKAPVISLNSGDKILIMSVRGLPRREGVAEYTQSEIDSATFSFSIYSVE